MCAQYWPSSKDGSGRIGAYSLQIEREVVKPSELVLRDLTITNMKVRSGCDQKLV